MWLSGWEASSESSLVSDEGSLSTTCMHLLYKILWPFLKDIPDQFQTSTPIKRCSSASPNVTLEPPPKRKQWKQNLAATKPISVEEHISKQELQTWISNKHFALLNVDHQILLNPVGWLNSSLISAAQILLREQSGAKTGLCLAQSMGSVWRVCADHLQRIWTLTNDQQHWSEWWCRGYGLWHLAINTFVQKQIAAMMTTESEIWVNIMDMQMQAGICDCGLFAIATATALVNGILPVECTFNQSEMCKHFYKSFNEEIITPFHLLKHRWAGKKVK